MKLSILTFTFLILVTQRIFSQQTPQELGEKVLTAFRTNTLDSLDSLAPTPDQLLELANGLGLEQTPERVAAFKKAYPRIQQQFRKNCEAIVQEGIAKKVDWANVRLQKVDTIKSRRDVPINLTEADKTITITSLQIHFSDGDNKAFIIQFKEIFNYHQIWKIGHQIAFGEAETVKEK
jgi:hypothetical protein